MAAQYPPGQALASATITITCGSNQHVCCPVVRAWPLGAMAGLILGFGGTAGLTSDFTPASQNFQQEVAIRFNQNDGLLPGPVQLLDCPATGGTRAFVSGKWYVFNRGLWTMKETLGPPKDSQFAFFDERGAEISVEVPWRDVRQFVRQGTEVYLTTRTKVFQAKNGRLTNLLWPEKRSVNQIAFDGSGILHIASNDGLFRQDADGWQRIEVSDL